MTTRTVYDVGGRIFDTEAEAQRYEILTNDLAAAELHLNNDGYLDSEGKNYRQQTPDAIAAFIFHVYKALKAAGESKSAAKWASNPRGIIGREWDDSNHPASRSYYRLQRIDDQCHEWGQPYFAINPNPQAVAL